MSDMKRAVVVKWVLPVVGALALGGCGGEQLNSLLGVPTPLPPPKVPIKPTKPVFTATDYITKGDPRPGVYRVTAVLSGELVTIQGVAAATPPATGAPAATPAAGATPTPAPQLGLPETVHLAGIITPAPNQPGWEGAVRTVLNWTALNPKDQTVEIEEDSHYPRDAQGRAMVQIYFKSTADGATRYNLNRMMIRSGYAVVDLYSATSIDVQKWLNDEQYARTSRLGLWKMGITLAQRIPPPMPGATAQNNGAGQSKGGAGSPRRPKGSAPVLRATPATSPRMTATAIPSPGAAPTGSPTPGAMPPSMPPSATGRP
jgi:endonuclease YncB( thermonuclease family)